MIPQNDKSKLEHYSYIMRATRTVEDPSQLIHHLIDEYQDIAYLLSVCIRDVEVYWNLIPKIQEEEQENDT